MGQRDKQRSIPILSGELGEILLKLGDLNLFLEERKGDDPDVFKLQVQERWAKLWGDVQGMFPLDRDDETPTCPKCSSQNINIRLGGATLVCNDCSMTFGPGTKIKCPNCGHDDLSGEVAKYCNTCKITFISGEEYRRPSV
jgi:ribosomal protein L37AE/L43A